MADQTSTVANASSNISNAAANAANVASNVSSSITQNIGSVRDTLSQSMNSFSSAATVNAGTEFLQSNSMIAKFVFIIFVLIMFMVFFSLGSSLLGYLLSPSRNPKLINGYRSGGSEKVITQDPSISESVVIYRSNNEKSGIEFTWSTWLNITGLRNPSNNISGKFNHIFSKGSTKFDTTTGLVEVNSSPGLYVSENTNKLRFTMNVVTPNGGRVDDDKFIEIENIPMKKWFHLAIRLQNHILDVYINGVIAKRVTFNETPKQNYDNVIFAHNNGFNGSISDLRYFSRALSIFEINSIVSYGPNLVTNDDNTGAASSYEYISGSWFTNLWSNA